MLQDRTPFCDGMLRHLVCDIVTWHVQSFSILDTFEHESKMSYCVRIIYGHETLAIGKETGGYMCTAAVFFVLCASISFSFVFVASCADLISRQRLTYSFKSGSTLRHSLSLS